MTFQMLSNAIQDAYGRDTYTVIAATGVEDACAVTNSTERGGFAAAIATKFATRVDVAVVTKDTVVHAGVVLEIVGYAALVSCVLYA